MNPRRILGTLSLLAALSLPASAQCLDWAEGLRAGGMDRSVSAFAWFDDGTGPRLYAGGEFRVASGAQADYLARWNGTNWEPVPGGPNGRVDALATLDDGNGPALYVGGSFVQVGSSSARSIARFDGASWSALGAGLQGSVYAIEMFDDGNGPALYAGGTFDSSGPTFIPGIARWNGSSWTTIGGVLGGGYEVFALEAFDDGSGPALYVGGSFTQAADLVVSNLARWSGSTWSAVGGDFYGGPVRALTTYDDGSTTVLVAAGRFASAGGVPASQIARWNGSTWAPFGSGMTSSSWADGVRAVQAFDDGVTTSLFAGGEFNTAGGVSASHVARWDGASWSALGSGVDGIARALAVRDGVSGPELVAGGEFLHAGNHYFARVATWDGSSWSSFDPGNAPANGAVHALAAYDEGLGTKLFAAGNFLDAGTSYATAIARWDGSSWSNVGGGATGSIAALHVFDDGSGAQLYAGGPFTTIGVVPANGLARWDGSLWNNVPGWEDLTFLGTPGVSEMVTLDDGSGAALYLAGGLYVTAPFSGRDVLRYQNGAWSPVGDPQDSYPAQLVVHDDGSGPTLYAGSFSGYAGPVFAARVVRWDGGTWSTIGSFTGGTISTYGSVFAIASHDDGSGPALYVAGNFAMNDGVPRANIARWKNGVWSDVGGGLAGTVRMLASLDDGSGHGRTLYAGGEITQAGGSIAVSYLARWDGASWSAVSGGVSSYFPQFPSSPTVSAACAWDDGHGRDLYFGGRFDAANGRPSTNVARLHGCGETGASFCYGDGSATACPCGNASAVGDRAGCLNSLGTGGVVRARGEPSVADDTLALDGSGMTNSSVLYFQGASQLNGGAGIVFGDGVACVGGPYVRLGTKVNGAGASSYPTGGDLSISVKGFVTSPVTRHYAGRYRNPAAFCTSDTFNYTNAVTIVWQP